MNENARTRTGTGTGTRPSEWGSLRALGVWAPFAVSFVATSSAALIGCPREDVTPQIEVSPGVGGRMGLLPRRAGTGGRQSGEGVTADAGKAAKARVHRLVKGQELAGKTAVGRPGDLVLENDEVVFVIDQLGAGTGFAESGGNVIDAADAKTRIDELGLFFSYFGTFPRQAVYDRLTAMGRAVLAVPPRQGSLF